MAILQSGNALSDTQGLNGLLNPRIAIVHTEWNDKIVAELIAGCKIEMEAFGGSITHSVIVPGCFELPFACKRLWHNMEGKLNAPEAIIAFGAVIRGGTPHFEYVSKAVTEGILQLNLSLPVPVIFGVLTLDTEAQAWERLGGVHGHKGREAGITALKMIRLCRQLI